ncbi:MAG: MmgE/PrpD family protein, partial [Gammaproteobacteria bacterium]|nr:MmgE/PrpD family protein [Gammaproteobacteria bacterium]
MAFATGFEVECKISEWMYPDHYLRGMHSSGTVGTFGAFAASAKLLGLSRGQLRHGFGIAASMAAGIRCNYGTMTKPLHVGRAAENGVTAAVLAKKGFTANQDALDGRWGFFAVHGRGVNEHKIDQGFGQTWSIVSPGVSIKPCPCGVLTHPTIDLMRKLVIENDLAPDAIDRVTVHAGSNILEPIRYSFAHDHLEAKFCLPAQLAMVAIARRAGKQEFSDEFVASKEMQSMQKRIHTQLDPEIEALGFDILRSRIVIELRNGKKLEEWADERYRGGPNNPLSDAELEDKVRNCCDGIIPRDDRDKLIETIRNLQEIRD